MATPLTGPIVLLVEDNIIIAFEAEDLLRQLGADHGVIAADLALQLRS